MLLTERAVLLLLALQPLSPLTYLLLASETSGGQVRGVHRYPLRCEGHRRPSQAATGALLPLPGQAVGNECVLSGGKLGLSRARPAAQSARGSSGRPIPAAARLLSAGSLGCRQSDFVVVDSTDIRRALQVSRLSSAASVHLLWSTGRGCTQRTQAQWSE